MDIDDGMVETWQLSLKHVIKFKLVIKRNHRNIIYFLIYCVQENRKRINNESLKENEVIPEKSKRPRLMNPQSSSEECSLQLKYSLYFSTFEPIHIFDFGDMAI